MALAGARVKARSLRLNKIVEIVLFLTPCRNKEKKVPYYSLISQVALQSGLVSYLIYVFGSDENETAYVMTVLLTGIPVFISVIGFLKNAFRYDKERDGDINPRL